MDQEIFSWHTRNGYLSIDILDHMPPFEYQIDDDRLTMSNNEETLVFRRTE